MIEEQKGAFSAGKAFSAGLTRIGKTVFDRVNKHTEDSKRIAEEKGDAARVAQRTKQAAADILKSRNISKDKLTISQIKTMLAPLKRTGDKALPTLNADIHKRLVEWEARGSQSVDEVVLNSVRAATTELQQAELAATEESDLVQDVEHPHSVEDV